jgi:hypothetical protein
VGCRCRGWPVRGRPGRGPRRGGSVGGLRGVFGRRRARRGCRWCVPVGVLRVGVVAGDRVEGYERDARVCAVAQYVGAGVVAEAESVLYRGHRCDGAGLGQVRCGYRGQAQVPDQCGVAQLGEGCEVFGDRVPAHVAQVYQVQVVASELAQAQRGLRGMRFTDAAEQQRAVSLVVDAALSTWSLSTEPPQPVVEPAPLRRSDGRVAPGWRGTGLRRRVRVRVRSSVPARCRSLGEDARR